MPGSQIPTAVTILNSLKGFQAISLTEYATSAAAAIASGSVVEIAGAYFTFAGDETINDSSWTAVTTGTTAYIELTPAGTAGSQVVTAAYSSTAPTWRDDLQGWYASAASNSRAIASVYKAEATSYYPKYLYNIMQDQKQRSISVLNASVASSLSVSESLSVDGTISAGTALNSLRIIPYNTIVSTGTNESAIFTAMSTSIPTDGQTMIVSGTVERVIGADIVVVSHATRNNSTRIYLHGYSITNTTVTTEFIDSGGTAVYLASLAW